MRTINVLQPQEPEKPKDWHVKAIACHYDFDRSAVLIGSVGHDLKLVIELCETLTHTGFDEMATYLLTNVPKPKFQLGIYINKDECLETALNRRVGVYDFNGENETDLPGIENLLKTLKANSRLVLPENMNIGELHVIKTLNILLKAFTKRLAGRMNIRTRYEKNDRGIPYPVEKKVLIGDPDDWDEPQPTFSYRWWGR